MSPSAALQGAGASPLPEATSWDVFIAHASGDAETARLLFEALRDGGCRPFLDSECLELGCDWDMELARAQRESLITVVLISSKTPGAHFEREEIQAAIDLARRRQTQHRVIPVWIEGPPTEHDQVPYGLRTKHGICLSQEVTIQVVAARLIQSVSRAFSRRPSLIRMPAVSAPSLPFKGSLARFALSAAVVIAVLMVRGLGQLAHEARVSILGVPPDQITYPEGELWQTGLKAVGGLFTSALTEVWGGEGAELWAVPVSAALAVGWVLLTRSRFRRTSLVLLPMAAVTLVVGVLLYAIAVKVTHVVVKDVSDPTSLKISTWTDELTFEVCSWFENGTKENGRRRAALEGLWGWLFASVCVTGTCSSRKWWRERSLIHGILGATCIIAALFLMRQAPRAYAVGARGLKYSRLVTLLKPCLPGLREGPLPERCQVWDVSENAREQVLVLVGEDCGPGGPTVRSVVLIPPEPKCVGGVASGHIWGER